MSRETKPDVVEMVVAYAKQETIQPLRGAGRWVAWGLVSMVLVSLGMVLVALGILRLLQDVGAEAFDGSMSWAPYGIGTVFAVCVVGFAVSQVRKSRL